MATGGVATPLFEIADLRGTEALASTWADRCLVHMVHDRLTRSVGWGTELMHPEICHRMPLHLQPDPLMRWTWTFLLPVLSLLPFQEARSAEAVLQPG